MRSRLAKAGKKGEISPEAAAPFMGAIEGERARPTISAVGSPSDIAAATRIERLERDLGKGAVARGAAYLREQGNAQPRFEDVMNLLEGAYQSRVSKGKVAKKNIIDESELAGTIGRKQAVAARDEDAAMARLLEGPLKPGTDFGSFRAPEAGPSLAAEVPSPVTAERRRRRLGVIPTAAAVTGGGLLASLALNTGGQD